MKAILYKGYIGTVEYSNEDKCYFGKVVGMNGLISYEGETLAELRKDFQDGIDHYLSLTENPMIPDYADYAFEVLDYKILERTTA